MIQAVLDLFFPPLCLHCKERTSLKYFCDDCWQLNRVLSPESRCIHCFQEIPPGQDLCGRCREKPWLPYQRAAVFDREAPIGQIMSWEESILPIAGFAYYQWMRLGWETPTIIAPIPPNKKEVARAFGELAQIPCPNVFRKVAWPIYPIQWEPREEMIEEDGTILLFDQGCKKEELQMAAQKISMAFPKNVYVLSLTL